jgi:hypothetical protein
VVYFFLPQTTLFLKDIVGPLPREVDAQNEDVEEIIRPNTGLNTRFGPGWKAELLAWQSELLSTMTFLIPAFGGTFDVSYFFIKNSDVFYTNRFT